jgi:hypothetical protein
MESIWKEAVMTKLKLLCRQFSVGAGEVRTVGVPTYIEPGSSQIQVGSVNA